MDRNDRARRQKQNNAAARQQNKSFRRSTGSQSAPRQAQPAAGRRTSPSSANVPSAQEVRSDHAPLYDQDQGRVDPVPQKRRGKNRHLHLTKKELRRRARRRWILALLGIVIAIAAGAVLSVALLFKVTTITIQNPEGGGQLAIQSTPAPASSDSMAAPLPDASPGGDAAGVTEGAESQPQAEDGADPTQEGMASPAPKQPEPSAAPQSTVNTGPYTEQQILDALGVQLGDNIFSFRLKERQQQMDLALPLLEQIQLRRRYPGTLELSVTPAVAAYCTETSEGWLVLSRTLKVMESAAQQPEGLPVILCDAKAAQPGTSLETMALERTRLSYERAVAAAQAAASAGTQEEPAPTMPPESMIRDANREALDELLTALEQAGLKEQATVLDAADPEELAFLYDGRISVLLGTTNELDYKLQLAGHILKNEDGQGCSATDAGVLDVSHLLSDGTIRATFRQGTALLPSQEKAQAAAQQAADANSGTSADAAASAADNG